MEALTVVPVAAFDDNYLWILRRGDWAAVVDPGDAKPVIAYLEAEKLTLTAILITHHHADHIGGNEALLRRYPVPVYGPSDERIATITRQVRDGDRFTLDALATSFAVIEVPGHTRSHIAYYREGAIFCGDTLFACGCGRLFEGTAPQMHASLARLGALPNDTRVYCAHEYTLSNLRFARAAEPSNPEIALWEAEAREQREQGRPTVPSTIDREKRANPFLRCNQSEIVNNAGRQAGMPLSGEVEVFAALRNWKNEFR